MRSPSPRDVPCSALSDRLPSLVVRYFRQFWGYAGARILAVVALTIVMTYAEGIGIALFFPLFEPAGQAVVERTVGDAVAPARRAAHPDDAR